MVDELRKRYNDRFSHYFTPSSSRTSTPRPRAASPGVGLTVTEVPEGLRVASVLPDTPAERAGLAGGRPDHRRRRQVDRRACPPRSRPRGSRARRGPRSSCGSSPPTAAKPRDVTLERADVRVPAVDGEIRRTPDGEKVAYVRFATFSEGAHGELRDEIERLYRRGAEGLVLDLRGNGGGLLNEAVLSTSVFVEDGNVVSTRSRTQGDRDYPARRRRARPAPDRGPRQPRHGLGLGDPDRGAAAERPRRGGRHPHLRQGHLPGGDRPARRAARST